MSNLSWILPFRSNELTFFFKPFIVFGTESFYFLFFAIGYWAWKKNLSRALGTLVCFSAIINCWLKIIFQIPRPKISQLVATVDYYSFPSGDVQVATTFFLTLALFTKKFSVWSISIFIIIGTALSRVYLGVHYPKDVVVGLIVGFIISIAYYRLQQKKILANKTITCLIISVIFLTFYFISIQNHLHHVNIAPAGALLGIQIGYLLDNIFNHYNSSPRLFLRVLTCIWGLITFTTLYCILMIFLTTYYSLIYVFIIYTLLTIHIVFFVPLTFNKIKTYIKRE